MVTGVPAGAVVGENRVIAGTPGEIDTLKGWSAVWAALSGAPLA
jgi:hypothetical protein